MREKFTRIDRYDYHSICSSSDSFDDISLISKDDRTPTASLSSKNNISLREIASMSFRQPGEDQSVASSNPVGTLINYADIRIKNSIRSSKPASYVEKKLDHAKIVVSRDPLETDTAATLLTEEEFETLRAIYKGLSKKVTFADCGGKLANERRNFQMVNPSTMLHADDKTTFNGNVIAEIDDLAGKKVKLVACMAINHKKPKQAEAFAKVMIKEGEEGRQVIVVNLTEEKEGFLYMPMPLTLSKKQNGIVEFGVSKESDSPDYRKRPYSFKLVSSHDGGGNDTTITTDRYSNSRFGEIKIQAESGQKLNPKRLIFLSSPFEDHQPFDYKRFRSLVKIIMKLIQDDVSSPEITLIIHCDAGMGRSGQLSMAVAAEAEILKKETPEELLVRMVIKYGDARRHAAFSEHGSMALYCYLRERKKEEGFEIGEKMLDLPAILDRLSRRLETEDFAENSFSKSEVPWRPSTFVKDKVFMAKEGYVALPINDPQKIWGVRLKKVDQTEPCALQNSQVFSFSEKTESQKKTPPKKLETNAQVKSHTAQNSQDSDFSKKTIPKRSNGPIATPLKKPTEQPTQTKSFSPQNNQKSTLAAEKQSLNSLAYGSRSGINQQTTSPKKPATREQAKFHPLQNNQAPDASTKTILERPSTQVATSLRKPAETAWAKSNEAESNQKSAVAAGKAREGAFNSGRYKSLPGMSQMNQKATLPIKPKEVAQVEGLCASQGDQVSAKSIDVDTRGYVFKDMAAFFKNASAPETKFEPAWR